MLDRADVTCNCGAAEFQSCTVVVLSWHEPRNSLAMFLRTELGQGCTCSDEPGRRVEDIWGRHVSFTPNLSA